MVATAAAVNHHPGGLFFRPFFSAADGWRAPAVLTGCKPGTSPQNCFFFCCGFSGNAETTGARKIRAYYLHMSKKSCTFAANLKNLSNMKKRQDNTPKTEEAAARKRAHQFGQPGANPSGSPTAAVNQREFYKWAETQATKEELEAYEADETKPYMRRRFVALCLKKCNSLQDIFELTNQTHGQPKQTIEQTNLPDIKIVLE